MLAKLKKSAYLKALSTSVSSTVSTIILLSLPVEGSLGITVIVSDEGAIEAECVVEVDVEEEDA